MAFNIHLMFVLHSAIKNNTLIRENGEARVVNVPGKLLILAKWSGMSHRAAVKGHS